MCSIQRNGAMQCQNITCVEDGAILDDCIFPVIGILIVQLSLSRGFHLSCIKLH